MIATARDKPQAYEGHPFIVEAAVSLGAKNDSFKEGITVVRFANRIPLLFEGGADVATRVAQTKIRWSNYKIDHKRDKIGVFVSIVSTKIPFKGTGKEYIGDDITEIQQSVRRALQSCCNQLKAHLVKRNALRDIKERKSRLIKYVPDVSRALFGLMDGMRKRKEMEGRKLDSDHTDEDEQLKKDSPSRIKKKLRLNEAASSQMIRKLEQNEVTEDAFKKLLISTIEAHHSESLQEEETGADTKGGKKGAVGRAEDLVPVYLMALKSLDEPQHDIQHPLFTLRPFKPVRHIKSGPNVEEEKKADDGSVISVSD